MKNTSSVANLVKLLADIGVALLGAGIMPTKTIEFCMSIFQIADMNGKHNLMHNHC